MLFNFTYRTNDTSYIEIGKNNNGKDFDLTIKELQLDLNDYVFFKATLRPKRISKTEFLLLSYGSYLIVRNDNIKMINIIDKWIEYLLTDKRLRIEYFHLSIPPIEVINKIKIIK